MPDSLEALVVSLKTKLGSDTIDDGTAQADLVVTVAAPGAGFRHRFWKAEISMLQPVGDNPSSVDIDLGTDNLTYVIDNPNGNIARYPIPFGPPPGTSILVDENTALVLTVSPTTADAYECYAVIYYDTVRVP